MKIAIAGDGHINKSIYGNVKDKDHQNLPFKTVDHMKAMTYIIDEVIKEQPDIMVFVGDTYDNFFPSPEIGGFFSSQLRRLKENNIMVFILVGNHEISKNKHALMPLKELDLDFVQVIDKPEILNFNGYALLMFPYSMEVEQDNISIKQQFKQFVDLFKTNYRNTPSSSFFFGHFGVVGATMSQWADKPNGIVTAQTMKRLSKKQFKNGSEDGITCDDLDSIGASYVFLGDYHKHQILPTKNCKAMYTGSIEINDINEMGQKKGFIIFDSNAEEDSKMGQCRFIEYKGCRKFVEIRGSWNEIVDGVKLLTNELDGAVVKIKFIGNSNQLVECSAGLSAIKDKIKAKINPIHIIYEQEIVDENVALPDVTSVNDMSLDASKIEGKDILDIVVEIVNEKQIDENSKANIIQIAREIHDKVLANIRN